MSHNLSKTNKTYLSTETQDVEVKRSAVRGPIFALHGVALRN